MPTPVLVGRGSSNLYMTDAGYFCAGTRKDGKPCRGYAIDGSRFCFTHAPEKAEARKLARSRGGRARHGRQLASGSTHDVSLETVADVVALLERTAQDLFSLENSVSRARAVAYVASVAVKALEVAELEQRLTRLEETVGLR